MSNDKNKPQPQKAPVKPLKESQEKLVPNSNRPNPPKENPLPEKTPPK